MKMRYNEDNHPVSDDNAEKEAHDEREIHQSPEAPLQIR